MTSFEKSSQIRQSFPDRIALRPVLINQDENFLINLYYSIREDLHNLPLRDEIKDQIMKMQYQAQKQHFESQFANLEEKIVFLDQKMCGRLLVSQDKDIIHLVDIALLPAYRNLGIGTILLQGVIEEALSKDKVITLHVLKTNPAGRLYQRLGFVLTNEKEMHYQMTYANPSSKTQTNI